MGCLSWVYNVKVLCVGMLWVVWVKPCSAVDV